MSSSASASCLAFFSFVGFESAAVLGAEAKDPHRLIPRSVILSVIGVGLLFIVSAYGSDEPASVVSSRRSTRRKRP